MPGPILQVVRENEDGVVISGMKMLANEVWIGNLVPLAAGQLAQSITCVLTCNAPGLSLWWRKPLHAVMTVCSTATASRPRPRRP